MQTDYPSLALGHAASSCTDISIVGLELKVYGLEEIKSSGLPVAAVIATHGRGNNQKQMSHVAHGILGRTQDLARGKAKRRDLIVVTLDQRNHGTRLKDKRANLSFDENPSHLVDMAACVVGGCQDVSLVIDFLAAYLFPHGDRVIEEFMTTGFSMGGIVVWRLLAYEPRIRIAIPICGLPWTSYTRTMGPRAAALNLSFEPPLYPPSIKGLLEPVLPGGCYKNKKILSIHGGADTLVSYKNGERDLAQAVSEGGGDVEVHIQEGAGHLLTPEAVEMMIDWIWKWGLEAPSQTTGYANL